MQEFPWPVCLTGLFGGYLLRAAWHTPEPVLVSPIQHEVHSLHEGSSELERVLSLQHELLQLCKRPEVATPPGFSASTVVIAALAGLLVGATAALVLASRLRGSAVAVATAHVRHDGRHGRSGGGEGEPRAEQRSIVNLPPHASSASSAASSDTGELGLKPRRGRLLQ
jgi:hypothetical protein